MSLCSYLFHTVLQKQPISNYAFSWQLLFHDLHQAIVYSFSEYAYVFKFKTCSGKCALRVATCIIIVVIVVMFYICEDRTIY